MASTKTLYGNASKDELNPKLFERSGKLRPNVRGVLERIADEFIQYLDEYGTAVDQVKVVGSSVSYNWNSMSDIDLHIVFDPEKVTNCDLEVFRELLLSKKSLFNDRYKIKIYGQDVEVYPEMKGDDNRSDYVYDLGSNMFTKKDPPKDPNTNAVQASSMVQIYENLIERVLNIEDPTLLIRAGTQLKEKIAQMRKAGLYEPKGNFSEKNVAFKTLRATGKLRKLSDAIDKAKSQTLSLKN
jgi:hypothetical protein